MGRPAKTLVERVLANTFRPGRYGALLAAERLPARSPFAGEQAVRLWRELRRTQQRYCDEPEHRDFHARDLGLLVRALHGGRVPAWYRDGQERSVKAIERFPARVAGVTLDLSRPDVLGKGDLLAVRLGRRRQQVRLL